MVLFVVVVVVVVPVTIRMHRNVTFRGFLIKARRADLGEDTNVPVGTFKDIPGTKHVCNRVSDVAFHKLVG